MRCSECQKDAVIRVAHKGKNYCADHFRRYFLAQVGGILNKYRIEGEVAVAVSGGKDSGACLEALTHFRRIEVRPFHINLGIDGYSRESLRRAKELAEELGLELNIVDLKGEYGVTIPELKARERGKICGLCGTIKRYLINKFAYENGLDYVATGHNLSDVVSSMFNNLANVYLTPFRGLEPYQEKMTEFKLVGRIKPLYYLKDEECLVYAETNGIPFHREACPFSSESPTNELKDWLHELDSRNPGILRNFARSFMRIEERMGRNKEEMRRCERCGYATATRVCRFCRVVGG